MAVGVWGLFDGTGLPVGVPDAAVGQITVSALLVEVLVGRLATPEDVLVPLYSQITTARFGTDLVVHPGGGDVPATITGDWPLVSGLPNLHGAVRRRFATVPGQLVHRPAYGVGAETYVGRLNSPTERSRLAAAARDNLLRDRRLEDVAASVGSPQAGRVEVALQIRPTGETDADQVAIVTEA